MASSVRTHKVAGRAVLSVAFIALVLSLARLLARARIAFTFPYAFDYGEGVVWQQMRDILSGQGYQPIGLQRAVAYEYPPLFHLFAAATARGTGIDELYAGRAVSFVSAGLCTILVGWLTARAVQGQPARVRLGAAAMAALVFAAVPMLGTWSLMMRIDLLACFFMLGGMLLASHAQGSMLAALAAGLAFTLSLYTRQTSLPAPAAAFIVLMFACPRRAWAMAASSMLSGLPVLLWLERVTHGGFLLNIVSYNVNRIIWEHASALGTTLLAGIVPIAIAAIGAITALRGMDLRGWQGLRAVASRQTTLAIVLVVLVLKTLMLPAILKSGASDNYLIDWFIPVCVLVGLASVPIQRAALGLSARPGLALSILFAIGLPIYIWGSPPLSDAAALGAQRRGLDAIVVRVARSERPVLTDDPTLLIRAGRPLRWETAIIAEMGSFGRYDERGFADKIRRRDFAFVVTDGDRGDALFDQRFNPAISEAIDAAYPRRMMLGGRTLHLPQAPGPDFPSGIGR